MQVYVGFCAFQSQLKCARAVIGVLGKLNAYGTNLRMLYICCMSQNFVKCGKVDRPSPVMLVGGRIPKQKRKGQACHW